MTAETKLDGKFLLSCTDDALPAADAARLFKGLLDVERGFRDLKRVLEVRPVHHRKEHRIRAHRPSRPHRWIRVEAKSAAR